MIIYLLTNRTNGKYYIGQTTQPLCDRLKQHAMDAMRKTGRLQQAIRKHGMGAFDVEILARPSSFDGLNDLEKLWIAVTAADKSGIGYNSTSGGRQCRHTEESRQRMAAAKRGRKQSPESVIKRTAPLRGRTLTGQVLENRRAGQRKSVTPERNARISATMKGRARPDLRGKVPWNKGIHGAQIAWNKGLPALNKGRAASPAVIERIRLAHIGLTYPNRKSPSKLQTAKGK